MLNNTLHTSHTATGLFVLAEINYGKSVLFFPWKDRRSDGYQGRISKCNGLQ